MRPLAPRALALAVLVGAAALLAPAADADITTAAEPPTWLAVLGAYRASSGLPIPTEDPSRRPGMDAHARYLSVTGLLQHGESAGHPLFTPEGNAAGAASVLGGWKGRTASDREHIEGWMRAPFHAVHLLEPRLRTTAFASVNDLPGSVLTSAAALDVIRGLSPAVAIDRTIVFPADGATVPLTHFETEHPDPLTACSGYRAPTGLPVLAMFPTATGNAAATVTDESGAVLPSCTVDTRYVNPSATDQALGRRLLTQKNAVFVVPRDPFVVGRRYTVMFTTATAGSATTTFTVADEGAALPSPSTTPLVITPKTAVRATTTLPPIRSRTLAVRLTTTKKKAKR